MDINQLIYAYKESGNNLLEEEKTKLRKIINLLLDQTIAQLSPNEKTAEVQPEVPTI